MRNIYKGAKNISLEILVTGFILDIFSCLNGQQNVQIFISDLI